MRTNLARGRASTRLVGVIAMLAATSFVFALRPVAADVGDTASGAGVAQGAGCGGRLVFEFEAIGATGNTADGTYLFECDFNSDTVIDSYFIGEVECLAVDGHRAFFSGPVVESSYPSEIGRDYGVVVIDAEAVGAPADATDEISNYYLDFPCEYPAYEAFSSELTTGNISVTDSTPPPPPSTGPTTKDDCKKGGWMQYPALNFKNQGQCVSYVARSGR